ncbi:MAG TPA: pilus assembly protein PilM [Candidatus Paceibacterota bacterium]|nr:pilus assembly protein PilM [Verrucomicrobiota bacterium]HRZ47006.1 pilus assembly protein PilM [Candidatus Paceibacterota bacterium]HRZ92876.1 pilus assembly protein PilM [Candidatus Paceibacterota bacterium]
MLKGKTFLGIDFGAGSLKVAEFDITEAGALCLKQFGVRPLGLEGSQESVREGALQRALQELLADRGFSAKMFSACAPGYHVFSKFVKLPPVDTSKVTQIIQYEAQQNVPFPLEEVVWDYQITGTAPGGELEVFLVAIKSEIVEGLFRLASAPGLRLQLVDVSPAALCNAFRYNYPDLDGCSMLLDIGAKTSNVLFFEKNKYSSRGINIGANSITQDFMAEVRIPFSKAEAFKIAEGFVSLGGAYEEPENPQQAQISKIARQVMTRLHIQVNQTIQFYRGQQGGSAPQRLFLAGGASIMPYTAQFFSEKLNLPEESVQYFNPLRNVQIDPAVNLEDLAKSAHSLGEVVGLGLRHLAQCPIELNLMPKTIRKRQELNQKKPYFVATLLSLVLALVAMGWFYDAKVVAAKRRAMAEIQAQAQPLQSLWDERLNPELQTASRLRQEADQVALWAGERLTWIEIMTELRSALLETEEAIAKERGVQTGIWIERMIPDIPGAEQSELTGLSSPVPRGPDTSGWSDDMKRRYGLLDAPVAPAEPGIEDPSAAAPASTNEIASVKLTCAAVSLKSVGPEIDVQIAHELERRLQSRTNLFLPEPMLGHDVKPPEENSITFSFDLTLKLQRPIKI